METEMKGGDPYNQYAVQPDSVEYESLPWYPSLSTVDLAKSQQTDPVVSRVRVLFNQNSENHPKGDRAAAESEEVRHYFRHWPQLQVVDDVMYKRDKCKITGELRRRL